MKALWDHGRVYFAFCRDSHIVAGRSRRDDPIYSTDDAVEMLINPESALQMDTEIMVVDG